MSPGRTIAPEYASDALDDAAVTVLMRLEHAAARGRRQGLERAGGPKDEASQHQQQREQGRNRPPQDPAGRAHDR